VLIVGTFSIAATIPQEDALAAMLQVLQSLLKHFERRCRKHCSLSVLAWHVCLECVACATSDANKPMHATHCSSDVVILQPPSLLGCEDLADL